jgi:hypothetical protein
LERREFWHEGFRPTEDCHGHATTIPDYEKTERLAATAQALLPDDIIDTALTSFTGLDSEDFYGMR